MKYCIVGLYYEYAKILGKEGCYGKQRFLGVKGKHRIYVYENKITKNTLMFDKKSDANQYLKEHDNLRGGLCIEKYYVLPIHYNN